MEDLIQVDVTLLTFLAGSLIPLLTAVVTKWRASSRLKAIVNLSLSVLAGVVAYLVGVEGETTVLGLLAAATTTYLASGTTYSNLWKPTGATSVLQQVTQDIGIGSPHMEDPNGTRNTPAPS